MPNLPSTEPLPWRALVLAAGAGTRMGGGKLRRLWRGRPLITYALEAAWAAPVETVSLVVGADGELAGLARGVAGGRPLEIVEATGWKGGLARSLRAGVASLPAEIAGTFVFLGDMPRLPHGVAADLAAALASGRVAAAPVFEGRRGHPVLLTRALFPAAMGGDGDRGAGALLAGLGDRLALVNTTDDGVLYDVDTPDLLET